MVRDGQLEKRWGGGGVVGGWGKSKKKNIFPQEIINNRIYSYGFWPKTKYAQRAGKTITDQL